MKDLHKKIVIWTIIILMCLALTVPYIAGLISRFFQPSSLDPNITIESQDIATSEAQRKIAEQVQQEYEASSSEAQRAEATKEIPSSDESVFTGKNLTEVSPEVSINTEN